MKMKIGANRALLLTAAAAGVISGEPTVCRSSSVRLGAESMWPGWPSLSASNLTIALSRSTLTVSTPRSESGQPCEGYLSVGFDPGSGDAHVAPVATTEHGGFERPAAGKDSRPRHSLSSHLQAPRLDNENNIDGDGGRTLLREGEGERGIETGVVRAESLSEGVSDGGMLPLSTVRLSLPARHIVGPDGAIGTQADAEAELVFRATGDPDSRVLRVVVLLTQEFDTDPGTRAENPFFTALDRARQEVAEGAAGKGPVRTSVVGSAHSLIPVPIRKFYMYPTTFESSGSDGCAGTPSTPRDVTIVLDGSKLVTEADLASLRAWVGACEGPASSPAAPPSAVLATPARDGPGSDSAGGDPARGMWIIVAVTVAAMAIAAAATAAFVARRRREMAMMRGAMAIASSGAEGEETALVVGHGEGGQAAGGDMELVAVGLGSDTGSIDE